MDYNKLYKDCELDPNFRSGRGINLERILKSYVVTENSTFVDVGSGDGNILILASLYNFNRIIGIEKAKHFVEMSKSNINIKGGDERISIFHKNIIDYEYEGDENVFYLFNPFINEVYKKFIKNLNISLKNNPRKVWLIIYNPVRGRGIIENNLNFEIKEYNPPPLSDPLMSDDHYIVYEYNPNPTIMIIPHPDDELIFLSKFLSDVDHVISAVKPDKSDKEEQKVKRGESFLKWQGRVPRKRSFVGLPDYVPDGIKPIPNFDEELNNFLSNFNGKIIIPGFNYDYGHPHHIQLEEYMHKNFKFIEKRTIILSEEECKLKIDTFRRCYPRNVYMLEATTGGDFISKELPGGWPNCSHTWGDFFRAGIEEALIFEKE